MVCATARTLTHKLEHLKLVPGVTPSDYINKFTTYFNQLNRLGGEHTMGPETAKTLFLENMEDPHHEVLVKSLRPHMHTHPLDWLMTELRRDERQDAVKGNTKRHIRRSQTGSGKRRRVNPSTGTGGTGTESLPSTIHPNLIGLINITPSSKWKALKQDHRSWVLSFNRAV